jgi:hypothetical protein
MSQESEDFGRLRRLLALKRYEQPPPGYFNGFSRLVIARIKAGDTGEESLPNWLFWESPWFQRLWAALQAKPILAGAFGAAVCSLLIFGVTFSERIDVEPVANFVAPEMPTDTPMQIANVSPSDQPLLAQPATWGFSDKTAFVQPVAAGAIHATLFDLVPKPQAKAASIGLILTPDRN